jgi:hypothetical protein
MNRRFGQDFKTVKIMELLNEKDYMIRFRSNEIEVHEYNSIWSEQVYYETEFQYYLEEGK